MSNSNAAMVVFEEKVTSFQKENEEAKRVFLRGSDEHLDLLLQIKEKIDPLTDKFTGLLNDLIPFSNTLTNDQTEKVIPLLLDLYSSAIQIVALLKKSSAANDLKATCQSYYSQVENLREFIYDLENFRGEDFGMDDILRQINKF